MNRTAITIWFMISPFCIDVGWTGLLRGYFYLKFVKYTGFIGNLLSIFVAIIGFFGFYMYFWMVIVESKRSINIIHIMRELIKSSFLYSCLSLLIFTYIVEKIWDLEFVTYISLYISLLIICLYTQDILSVKLWHVVEQQEFKCIHNQEKKKK